MDDTRIPVIEKKKKKFWKYIVRIFLSILIFFIVLIGTASIIIYFSQDKIKKLIISQINKQLSTEIQVKDVELSLFQKFPNVSLTFTDVTAKDAITSANKGNLLKAENVYLQFSIWDLFIGEYKIKKLDIKNGTLNILVYKDGTDNYHFWKSDTTSTNKSFSFDLQKVILDNVNLRYKDFSSDQDYSALAKNLVLKGKFRSDDYSTYIYGNLYVNYIDVTGVKYFTARNATIDLVMNVNSITDTYTFSEGGFLVGNLKFDMTGNVVDSDFKHTLDLKINGSELKLQSFIDEMPKEYSDYFKNFEGKGEFYFTAIINGSYAGKDIPSIKINFGISKGEIAQKKSNISLENVNFSGEFTNGNRHTLKSSVLTIKDFKTKLKSGSFNGDLSITNMASPEIALILDAKMNLSDVLEFLKPEKISSLTGSMEMKVSFKGSLDSSSSFTTKDFVKSKTSGILKIANAELELKNDTRKFTKINGDFDFSNNDLVVNKLTGNILNSDFSVKGYFRNLLSFIFLKDQKLLIDADLKSGNVDLGELLQSNSTTSDTSYNLALSDKLDIKLDININKLTFNKFNCSSISGKARLKNKQLLVSPLLFNAMDGSVSGLVMIDGSQDKKLLISCDAKIAEVNINKLFYEFGNFGQNSLKDDNLKGTVTADVQFASVWSNNLEPDMDMIYSKADIKIKNGELLNYAPMQGLSKFLKMSDLNDVKFATLHNQIEIKKRTIYIPTMEIKSSAIDITASGEHTFNNDINYSIKLLLSDLMAQKAKKAKKENEEFGVVENDNLGKTSLYILVTGTVDKPVYKYDAKGVKAKIAVSVIKEKQNLKTILNEEFGWFKKDTAIAKKPTNKLEKAKPKGSKEKENLKKQEEGKFIIEWGDSL